ncbi:hypothetical protein X777_02103, partial [Ooceraea biroi]
RQKKQKKQKKKRKKKKKKKTDREGRAGRIVSAGWLPAGARIEGTSRGEKKEIVGGWRMVAWRWLKERSAAAEEEARRQKKKEKRRRRRTRRLRRARREREKERKRPRDAKGNFFISRPSPLLAPPPARRPPPRRRSGSLAEVEAEDDREIRLSLIENFTGKEAFILNIRSPDDLSGANKWREKKRHKDVSSGGNSSNSNSVRSIRNSSNGGGNSTGASNAAVQRKETQPGLAPKRHTGGRGAYPYAAHRVAAI